jgi:hypothetical protein
MAAITLQSFLGTFKQIRSGSAQANTGQTDWIAVPPWALFAEVTINITAVAGTTPVLTPAFFGCDPTTLDDTDTYPLHAAITSPPTAASTHRILIGPGLGDTSDVALAAAADSQAQINTPLPPVLGVQITLDRAEANETYTYTVAVKFRR